MTKLPSGALVSWVYGFGKTENQEHEGPGEYGDVEFTPVEERTETIVVTRYVPIGENVE